MKSLRRSEVLVVDACSPFVCQQVFPFPPPLSKGRSQVFKGPGSKLK